MELFEKTIKTEDVYNGRIFTVKTSVVELPDGSQAPRDTVVHTGGVCVIARTADGKIPMVRQYRKGIEQVTLELPAGKLEQGEDPRECGIRELKEETGYCAEKFSLLTKIAPTPAYCSEIIYIYQAEEMYYEGQRLDEGELLNLEYYTLDELKEKVRLGEIIDAKTIVGIMMI